MTIRRLVMLRHGQTEYNAGSRMQGQLDTDLTDLGRAQASAAAEILAKRQPLLIVSAVVYGRITPPCGTGPTTARSVHRLPSKPSHGEPRVRSRRRERKPVQSR